MWLGIENSAAKHAEGHAGIPVPLIKSGRAPFTDGMHHLHHIDEFVIVLRHCERCGLYSKSSVGCSVDSRMILLQLTV